MGIRDTFKNAALAVHNAFGDVNVSASYEALVTTSYNASTGSMTNVYSTVAGVSVIFSEFEVARVDSKDQLIDDRIALIPGIQLDSVTPRVDDRIVISSAIIWRVVEPPTDAAGAEYQMRVRKTDGRT